MQGSTDAASRLANLVRPGRLRGAIDDAGTSRERERAGHDIAASPGATGSSTVVRLSCRLLHLGAPPDARPTAGGHPGIRNADADAR
jgi:hypothetical protein